MKRTTYLLIIFLTVVIVQSCWYNKGKNIPDVSHIDINFNIDRFEQDLFKIDTNQVDAEIQQLVTDYPVFFKEVYIPKILPALQDPKVMEYFVKSESMRQLYDTCMIVYEDMDDIEKELKQALSLIHI